MQLFTFKLLLLPTFLCVVVFFVGCKDGETDKKESVLAGTHETKIETKEPLQTTAQATKKPARELKPAPLTSLYEYEITSIDGKKTSMAEFKGKNILIVNTASKCGYTYQYEGLQKLYTEYGKDLVILGFPSNDFLWQEPGNNEKINTFCSVKFGVTFPMFEKIVVKGKNKAPLYEWLTNPALNGWNSSKPSWNFCKYLINREGTLVAFFGSKVEPLSKAITDLIQ